MKRLRRPQTTVRWRLTLLYGGLFLICGVGLLAITYGLVHHATVTTRVPTFVAANGKAASPFGRVQRPAFAAHLPRAQRLSAPSGTHPGTVVVPTQILKALRSRDGLIAIRLVNSQQRISDLHSLEVESGIALAIMTVISGLLGWFVAGRVLRPLRTIAATTQQISEENLHQRLAIPGPRDELRRLADTIDGLLERLEGAFDAQRRFVANASHELRTPLTATRAVLELALEDPDASVATFKEACRAAIEEGEQQELLIDALLALAQGQRGLEWREPLELATLTEKLLTAFEPDAAEAGVRFEVALSSAPISGDRRLIERLLSNLIENAVVHNRPNGSVSVRVESRAGRARLAISNTGPPVPAAEIDRLLQPFQRLVPDRVGDGNGLGLGLSIVAAIAAAHDATLEIRSGADGGLEIEMSFLRPEGAELTLPSEVRGPAAPVIATRA